MIPPDAALGRLALALETARRLGADAADAVLAAESGIGIGVRLGRLEDVGRTESADLGIRVFRGQRSAQVSVSDLSDAAIAEAVARAIAIADAAPEDRFAGLAPEDLLARGPFPDFDLHDPAAAALSPAELQEMALAAEAAALAVPGVTNSEGGSAGASEGLLALATSHGFAGVRRGTRVSVSAVAIAGEGADRQRDFEWSEARHLADLEAPEAVGRTAGTRAVRRLSPVLPPTGPMPVVFDPRVAGSLLSHLASAMAGPAVARGTSFLIGRESEQLFPAEVRIRDDPHRPRGLRSRAFDAEGLATAPRALVEEGRITGWLLDTASARQLGLAPTGHASRGVAGPPGVSVSNLHLEPGTLSSSALLSDIALGLYVTELIGMGVNGLTGDYSRGATGFLIRHGALAEPVAEATIAGNLRDMFRSLRPADDLVFRRAVNAPTVRIEGMTVAGGHG